MRIRPMRFALRVALCAALVSTGGVAAAQETVAAGGTPTSAVRVVKDRATIWTRNPSMVLAVAPVGTVLKAISRDDKWYEVEVPGTLAGRPGGAVGFVLAAHVELVPGAPAPPARAATRSDSQWDPVGAGSGAGTVTSSRPAAPPPAFGIRGFGSLNYMFFNAHDSFEAIFGASSYPFFGGGGEVIFARHFFVSGTVEHFQKTGERVFVSNGEVFKLGLDDKVSITPVSITGGYRLNSADRLVPYVGGGQGSTGSRKRRSSRTRTKTPRTRSRATTHSPAWNTAPRSGYSPRSKCSTRPCPTRSALRACLANSGRRTWADSRSGRRS